MTTLSDILQRLTELNIFIKTSQKTMVKKFAFLKIRHILAILL
jgi:hypothetical protein